MAAPGTSREVPAGHEKRSLLEATHTEECLGQLSGGPSDALFGRLWELPVQHLVDECVDCLLIGLIVSYFQKLLIPGTHAKDEVVVGHSLLPSDGPGVSPDRDCLYFLYCRYLLRRNPRQATGTPWLHFGNSTRLRGHQELRRAPEGFKQAL